MATRTIFGLLAGTVVFRHDLFPKNAALEGIFEFNDNLIIRKTPQPIHDFTIPNPFEPLSFWEQEAIQHSTQCISYTYTYETPESAPESNLLEKYYQVIGEATKFPMTLPLLAAIKLRINLFPYILIVAAPDGTNPHIARKLSMPLDVYFTPKIQTYLERFSTEQQLNEVAEDFPRFQDKIRTSNRFSIAINLFERALFEDSQAIALLLIASTLESLFNVHGDEITHKLRVRTACFLEKDFRERERIYRDIAKCYKTRSNLIHGGRTSSTEIAKAFELMREYTRRVLCQFLVDKAACDALDLNNKDYSDRFLKRLDLGNYNPGIKPT